MAVQTTAAKADGKVMSSVLRYAASHQQCKSHYMDTLQIHLFLVKNPAVARWTRTISTQITSLSVWIDLVLVTIH